MASEKKAIRLLADRPFDEKGNRQVMLVLPSANLRAIVERRMREAYPELNYIVRWRDVNGFGIQMFHADWVRPGGCYVCD